MPLIEKIAERLKTKDYALSPLAAAATWPVRGAGSGIKRIAYGPELKTGPMKGKNYKPTGLQAITSGEYDTLVKRAKHGASVPRVVMVEAENGSKFHFKVKYGRGGLVGFAQRRPLLALGLGGASLYGAAKLLSNRKTKEATPETNNKAW